MSATYDFDCECDNFEMLEDQDVFTMNEGIPGPGVPAGGSAGQILQKHSDADYDTEWTTPDGYVPAGGSSGQILKKSSAADYDTEWDSLDAGDVSFDSSLTYASGTVGEELNSQRNTLNHKADLIYDTASGDIASFPDGADGLPVKDLTVGIEPVQAGSGDPSPTNVRPISGWTGAKVTRANENIISEVKTGVALVVVDEGFQYKSMNGTCLLFSCKKGQTYYLTKPSSANREAWGFFDHIPNANDKTGYTALPADDRATAPIDGYCVIYVHNASDSAIGSVCMVSLHDNETFVQADTTVYSITFPSEAGTVYGGTLDVTSGVLTVTWIQCLLKDQTIVRRGTNTQNVYRFAFRPNPMTKATYEDISVLSNVLKGETAYRSYSNRVEYCITPDANESYINFYASDIQTIEDWQTFAVNNNVQVVYELATPIPYQLTPQEVTTLLGVNNIWADCGPSTVEYPCDTKLYIQKINAPTDDDMIADANIASGQYFIVNNNLYLSTTTILAGDPIKPGTNCTLTNLAAALNALNS